MKVDKQVSFQVPEDQENARSFTNINIIKPITESHLPFFTMSEYILDFLQFLRVKGPLFVKLIIAIVLSVLNGISYVILNLHVLIPLVINYYVKILSPNNIPSLKTRSKVPPVENTIRVFRIESKHGADRLSAIFTLLKESISESKELQDVGVFKLWFGSVVFVMITRPEAAEIILRKTNMPKAWLYKAFETENLGINLFTGNGDTSKMHRKLFSPAFYAICESVPPVMNEHSRDMVIAFKDLIVKNNGITDDISAFFKHCVFDILFEAACGLSSKSNRPGYREANHAFIDHNKIIVYRATRPWLIFEPLFQMTATAQKKAHLLEIILSFFDKIYKERRAKIKEDTNNAKKNFLDVLITENINNPKLMIYPDDVQGQMMGFLSAGFDTTVQALDWTFLLLGHHPEVQDKIIQELDDILGDTDDDITLEDIRRLKYTEAVAKEGMRLYPVANFLARDITEDTEVPLGQTGRTATLPTGTTVIVCPHFVHRSQPHWPDPEVFDPERFLNNEKKHPYSFIPFSAGPRNCIGQKFAMIVYVCILAYFFRNFRIKTLIPMSEVKACHGTTYMACGSNPVQIELREKNSH